MTGRKGKAATGELVEVPVVTTAIAEYNRTAAALAELEKQFAGATFPVETKEGMDSAKKARMTLRTLRTDLERKRKEIKAPALERCRLIDSEAERITKALVELENPIHLQIKTEENRIEAEREAKRAAEAAAAAALKARVDQLRNTPGAYVNASSDEIAGAIARGRALDFADEPEFDAIELTMARDAAVAQLEAMREAAVSRETLAAEAAAAKAEVMKLREQLAASERTAALERERSKVLTAELDAAKEPDPVPPPPESLALFSQEDRDGGVTEPPQSTPKPVPAPRVATTTPEPAAPVAQAAEGGKPIHGPLSYLSALLVTWQSLDADGYYRQELPKLREVRDAVVWLVVASRKFADLLQPDAVGAHAASQPDEQGVYGINGVTITLGDLRKLRAAVDRFERLQS